MIERSIAQLAEMITVENDITEIQDVLFKNVCIDSRKIEAGNLFIPFKGEHVDGHKFVRGAIENGAAASFWEGDVPNPPTDLPIIIVEDSLKALQQLATSYRKQLGLKVIGITGSNGKTTTKDMTANLLSLKYRVQKTEGNYNSHIGLPLTILALDPTTEVAVLEMGMSGFGEIEELSNIALPDAAIITNIGESHLQDLGSREGIARAKLEITKGLKNNGLLVYFGEEPLIQTQLGDDFSFRTKTFGKTEQNDLYPTKISSTPNGSVFYTNQSREIAFSLPVLGQHNILNALAAMLIAEEFNVGYDEMPEALQKLKLTAMRMELIEGEHGEKIINDAYNASPTSVRAAIDLVSSLEGFNKKILILGDMLELGKEEETFHYEVGKEIPHPSIDYVFTFGNLASHIAKGAIENLGTERVTSFENKEKLAKQVKSIVESNDLILVKGSRGMKLEEVIEFLKSSS
ncbi:UDP-N-acetylmuramoyl-tripeptide--D-alanyl-D-alanine ligase [Rossellomorea sp. BNER]|uniref:UDP-N-acetylmuramoyl-tripeptide--D-alanyl-D- alanine ligase n=1 Tax=Rossellomorea sp. BNER TaxID=2962031 RepID=UPI003AF2C21C|nr:UDP-N-acetylmuramoyl-tripeptide--D-alanyl-D-alanine ligase [Rossellomorea sp. BNER]